MSWNRRIFQLFEHPSRIGIAVVALAALGLNVAHSVAIAQIEYVFQISVDGLRPSAITTLTASGAPNFWRLRNEGAFTDNARTDVDYSITLPNHTSQLTGRPVNNVGAFGANSGHKYTNNGEPGAATLHSNAGYYIASAFDVAHDNGLKTGLYATKSKFVLYDQSYNSSIGGGAADVTGVDNGKDKVDVYVNPDTNSTSMMTSFLGNMANPLMRTDYTFLHFHDPDSAGHSSNWSDTVGSTYLNAVAKVDGYIGQILNLIDTNAEFTGKSAIVLTADHGGIVGTKGHEPASNAQNYTIPFYTWGPNIVPGGDLYAMNSGIRTNPSTGRPAYALTNQPIRNGDAGNLALDLLHLPAIPGSKINNLQNLIVPEPSSFVLGAFAFLGLLGVCRRLRRAQSTA